jgi:hypothetical protein
MVQANLRNTVILETAHKIYEKLPVECECNNATMDKHVRKISIFIHPKKNK